jgi:hypothetical protein
MSDNDISTLRISKHGNDLNNLFAHKRNRLAFEDLVRQEAHKFVTRSTLKRVADTSKNYGLTIAVPNAIAGALGYVVGGTDGSLQAMKQFSTSVLPFALLLLGANDYMLSTKPMDNINYVIDVKKNSVIKSMKFTESPLVTALSAGVGVVLHLQHILYCLISLS